MRALRIAVVGVLSVLIIVVLALFAMENVQRVPAHFARGSFTPTLWWLSIGSAVLGCALAVLLFAPGRVAARWHARSLSRERVWLEIELEALRVEHGKLRSEYEAQQAERETLRAQYADLQTEHNDVRTERDQLRDRLAAVTEVVAEGVPLATFRTDTVAAMTPPNQQTGDRFETTLETLRAEHGKLRAEHEALGGEHRWLRAENEALRAQYADLQAEHEHAQAERDQARDRLAAVNAVLAEVTSDGTLPAESPAASRIKVRTATATATDAAVAPPEERSETTQIEELSESRIGRGSHGIFGQSPLAF